MIALGEMIRTCIGCRKKGQKQDFIRVIKNEDKEVDIDVSGKAQTRGAYVCRDVKCVEKLRKSHRLRKLFEIEDDSIILNKLECFLENET